MQERFQVYVRQHLNNWYTLSALAQPRFAVFGERLRPLREELAAALAEALATDALERAAPDRAEAYERRVLDVTLRAVQHDRLIEVPMRFLVLHRALDEARYEVLIPRLTKRFTIQGAENIAPWSEEVIRGHFHLDDVSALVRYQYGRSEHVEPLDVVYHGARRYRKTRATPSLRLDDEAQMASLRSPLARLGQELVAEAAAGRLARAYHRERAVDELLGALMSQQASSVLLVGAAGVGKSALVHELAHRVAREEAPAALIGTPIWHITGGRLIAGMRYLGQWQERCLAMVRELRGVRGVLFADSLLELQTAGSVQSGMNVATLLQPFIESGELRVIVETTPDGLLVAEQQGAGFVHALRHIQVSPLDGAQAFEVLELAAGRLQRAHRVRFSSAAIQQALDVLARFGDADALPGSGLSLLESMARAGGRDETLDGRAAIAAFSRASGFPQALIDPERLLDVEAVRAFFTERVIGQAPAMELLTRLVMVLKASLNDPERPLGVFLFMGPTGVGKTEAARSLAAYLFGDPERLVRLDMSEYGQPGAATRLIGGVRGEGALTGAIRKQPFSVVLLDEIEKASADVFDVLLQALGEGRLTDETGQTVRLRHCIVIMTSNLGVAEARPIGLVPDAARDDQARYVRAARACFRPEFINRLDFIVPFASLDAPVVRAIARRMLAQALAREGFARRRITVTYGEPLLDLLMRHGFEPRYGARPMKRAIERHVLVPISRRLVRRDRAPDGDERLELYVHDGRVAVASSRGVGGVPARQLPALAIEHDALYQRHLATARRRLDAWHESWLMRALREEGTRAFDARAAAVAAALDDLERASQSAPSTLAPPRRAALLEATQRVDADLRALEWDLCMRALDGRADAALCVEASSPHPQGPRLVDALVAQLTRWFTSRGVEVRAEPAPGPRTLALRGAGAATWAATLHGLHRFTLDDDAARVDLVVRPPDAPAPEAPVRHYAAAPPTIWDPDTDVTLHASLDALAEHLDDLVLGRMCLELGGLNAPSPS